MPGAGSVGNRNPSVVLPQRQQQAPASAKPQLPPNARPPSLGSVKVPTGSHNPDKPVDSAEGRARGLEGPGAEPAKAKGSIMSRVMAGNENKLPPEGGRLRKKQPDPKPEPSLMDKHTPTGPGHRPNAPLNHAANNFPDIRPDSHHVASPGGVVIDAVHGNLHGTGPATSASALAGSDPDTVPASYTPNMASRVGLPADRYTGQAGTKAETVKEHKGYEKILSTTNAGGPDTNNVVLSHSKAALSHVKEKQSGQTAPHTNHAASEEVKKATLAGSAEASWTSGAVRHESRHETSAGTTAVNASLEGPSAKLAAEGEMRFSKNPSKAGSSEERGWRQRLSDKLPTAMALHGKTEASAMLGKAEVRAEHTSPNENYSVGGQAFANAGAFSVNEASLVADREKKTYMAKLTSINLAAAQAGGGVSMRAGPLQVDMLAAKMFGAGAGFNAAAGMNNGNLQILGDVAGVMGPGGRLRMGATLDTERMQGYYRDHQNKKNNENFSQEVAGRSKMPSLEAREQFANQVVRENLFANQMNTPEMAEAVKRMNAGKVLDNRRADLLNTTLPQAHAAQAAQTQGAAGQSWTPSLPTIAEERRTARPPALSTIAEE